MSDKDRYALDPKYRSAQKERARRRQRMVANMGSVYAECAEKRRVELEKSIKHFGSLEKFRAAKRMWIGARNRSTAANLPFSITPEDIQVPDDCPVFGLPLELSATNENRQWAASLDRKVPRLGYVPGNITVMSMRANTLKRDGSLVEFEMLVDWLKS